MHKTYNMLSTDTDGDQENSDTEGMQATTHFIQVLL